MTEKFKESMLKNQGRIVLYDKAGEECDLRRYLYPVNEEFIKTVGADSYKEESSLYGESCLRLKFNDKSDEYNNFYCTLCEGDYFDILHKKSVGQYHIPNEYYIYKPTEKEIYENKINSLKEIIDEHYENLSDEIENSLRKIDEKLYYYRKDFDIDSNVYKMTTDISLKLEEIKDMCYNMFDKINKETNKKR